MIDMFHKDGVTHDYSTLREISKAASLTVFGCVRKSTGYSGGYIRDVGKHFQLLTLDTLPQRRGTRLMFSQEC